jgi:hypothetical protein
MGGNAYRRACRELESCASRRTTHENTGALGGMMKSYHELYRVTRFEIVGNYVLRVWFDDGSEQTIDFEPVLYGSMWGPLRDLNVFNQVRLDPEAETLVWPNEADFDPETLRNWPLYKDRLAERAQSWEKPTAAVS